MTSSPAVSHPSTPRGSLSRSSSPTLNECHRSAPIVPTPAPTPLPDSRSCSPYSLARSTTYQSPPASPTVRSKESSPVRSSELYAGRWISQKARKHRSEPLAPPPSPLRAPPMLAPMPSSSSSASSLSRASEVSYTPNTSFSTAPTSFSNSQVMVELGTFTPPTETSVASHGHQRHDSASSSPSSLPQYKSLSESISETCERLCEKLKKSLRVMWRQGKRCEFEQGTEVKPEETVDARPAAELPTEPISQSAAAESQVKNGGPESMTKRWKRKSADSIRNLDKAYRQRKDSVTTKTTDAAADSGPSPSSDKPIEKSLPPVPEVADFVDLRDPFACHTSGSPQVVKYTASTLPPPSSFRYAAKMIEARRRARRLAGLDRTGSTGKSSNSGRPGSAGSAGRPGSAGSTTGRPRSKFERRVGASLCLVAARRLRPTTPKRSVDAKPFPILGPIVPSKAASASSPTPPFAYTLVPVRPLRVRKRSAQSRPSTPTRLLVANLSTPQKINDSLNSDTPAPLSTSQIPAASQRRFNRVVKPSSPFSSRSRPLTPPRGSSNSKPFVPIVLTLPTGPVVDSSLPTPPLTPSSPVTPSFSPISSTPSSSLPQTPVRVRSPTVGHGINSAKSLPELSPSRTVTPFSDGRLWI
ncbi:hypothetical protein F5887DRAFT_166429 [Amanita rubescens]|nr:hypothetical protein F5887DRAFT_166429 [Amanita rubescens]